MSEGAVPLSAYPFPKVILACRRCERRARFDKAALIERVGADASLPELRLKLAGAMGCGLAKMQAAEFRPGYEQCGAQFPELLTAARKQGS
jgi:hypothetical protein